MATAFRQHYQASVATAAHEKPGTVAQLAYSEDTAEVVIIRVFPTADDLDRQLEGSDDRSKTTYQLIEPIAIELYGAPSSFALNKMRSVAGPGVAVTIISNYLGGFLRT